MTPQTCGRLREAVNLAPTPTAWDLARVKLSPVDVLVVAAHPIELAPLRSRLASESPSVCGRRTIATVHVGVGMPDAGGGATEALLRFTPAVLVLLGSYGVYPSTEQVLPGELLVPDRIAGVDEAVLRGSAAIPTAMAASAHVHVALADDLAAPPRALRRGALATTLGITTDSTLAARLGKLSGCHGENLEALAVALSCHRAGVAFVALVGCTNEVGPNGRSQWAEHHPSVAEATADTLCDWLKGPSDALDCTLAAMRGAR